MQVRLHDGIITKLRHRKGLLHRGHGKLCKRMLATTIASIQTNATARMDQLFSKTTLSKEPNTNVPGM
jgi:hypothetical protein